MENDIYLEISALQYSADCRTVYIINGIILVNQIF